MTATTKATVGARLGELVSRAPRQRPTAIAVLEPELGGLLDGVLTALLPGQAAHPLAGGQPTFVLARDRRDGACRFGGTLRDGGRAARIRAASGR